MTIIEFGDYECPFCRLHFTNTLPDIVKKYVETGKIRYIFRNYPLSSIHDHALDAAVAVQCALEQGNEKGIELHDLVYTADMEATPANLETWAKTVKGLNPTTWKTCIQSDDAMDAVEADMNAAELAGLTGTPFFVIIAPDGSTEVILGSQPFDIFNEVIEILLTR
jgi:protein-disulfide isomerase